MSLRAQLLLVSLLTLALPWAGWQYVLEMELSQRRAQQENLLGSAFVVASALRGRRDLLYRDEALADAPRDAEGDLYARALERPLRLDGFAHDWGPELEPLPATLDGGTRPGVRYLAGVQSRFLHLWLSVRDRNVSEYDPVLGGLVAYDQVVLSFDTPDGGREAYRFPLQAPGPITAIDAITGSPAPRLRGHSRRTAAGYAMEIQLPLALVGARFGYAVLDADATGYAGWAGSLTPIPGVALDASAAAAEPGWLIYPSLALARRLDEFVLSEKRLRVVDRAGWELATVGDLATARRDAPARGLGDRLLRLVLDAEAATLEVFDATATDLPAGVGDVLNGRPDSAWYRASVAERVVVVAQPIRADEQLIGAVVLEQRSDAILTLGDRALTRLVVTTFLVTLLVGALLLGYASVLSIRIRRLRNAAEQALDPRGLVRSAMPGGRARDELGDLSRSFSTLLARLREHTQYLQTLAGKLSHELRTPLAVVRSSLDNLAQQDLSDGAQVYAGRARDGLDRLQSILVAMSEASRVEQAIEGAEPETFDLLELLRGSVQAYADIYPDRRIALKAPDGSCAVRGVPELIVQLLDKLVDNAADFTPSGGLIEVSLIASDTDRVIAVANEGPPLPSHMRNRLFDSMVAVRDKKGERPHLGFGLYIARLIAESHNGIVEAHNLANRAGVEFRVRLPAPPERAAH